MELLSVEYGDFDALCEWEQSTGSQSACLKVSLFVDPALLSSEQALRQMLDALAPIFPGVGSAIPDGTHGADLVAYLTGAVILDLQRDLCEWPGGKRLSCRPVAEGGDYELYVESIDERVGRFAAQLAVNTVRMMLLEERFDPRLVWVIDLVRQLRRHPRLRLHPKRVAVQLGCSASSAKWAIQELERYGYAYTTKVRRSRRARGGRILIVDDSAQVRDLLSRILEGMGYDVITAVDGEEGLILLDWSSYRCVFVDLMMPCMDGFAFLKHAQAQGVTCPLFVISAYDHRWRPDEMDEVGATAFLAKPFSVSEIDALLRKHLRRKR